MVLGAAVIALTAGVVTVAGLFDDSAPAATGPLAFPTPSTTGSEHRAGPGADARAAGERSSAAASSSDTSGWSSTSSPVGYPAADGSSPVTTAVPATPSGTLRGPRDPGAVPAVVTVTGTVHGLARGQAAWVAVLDVRARRYYPERRPLTVAADGTWTARIALGPTSAASASVAASAGLRYQVVLVLADPRAAAKLSAYGARPATSTGTGLAKLPAGTVTLASLSLRRA